jgi:hypothetical protein
VRQIVFSHLGSFANAKRANPPANAGGLAEKGCGAHRHWRSKGTLASKGRARIDRGAVEAVRVRRSKRRRRSGQRRTARRLVSPARSRGLCSNLDHMLHWCPRAIFFAASKAQFAIGWEREGQFAYRAWTKLEAAPTGNRLGVGHVKVSRNDRTQRVPQHRFQPGRAEPVQRPPGQSGRIAERRIAVRARYRFRTIGFWPSILCCATMDAAAGRIRMQTLQSCEPARSATYVALLANSAHVRSRRRVGSVARVAVSRVPADASAVRIRGAAANLRSFLFQGSRTPSE